MLVAADGYVPRVVARPDRDDRAARSSSLRGEIDRRCQPPTSLAYPRSASYASPRTLHARARLPGLPLRVSFTADVLHPGALRYGLCATYTYTLIHLHTHTYIIHIYTYMYVYIIYICALYIYSTAGRKCFARSSSSHAQSVRSTGAFRSSLSLSSSPAAAAAPAYRGRRSALAPFLRPDSRTSTSIELPCPALDTLIRPVRPPHDGLCFLLSSGS